MGRMNLFGTEQECAEAIAQVDAERGYPRGYTQADIDSGLVKRIGVGRHVPIEEIRTETVASVQPVDVDEEGNPTSARRVVRFWLSDDAPRRIVARARVLRLLNRAPKRRLVEVPGIGPARADQIIAARAGGRMTDIEDVRNAGLPPAAVQAIRDYVMTQTGDDDADEDDGESRRIR